MDRATAVEIIREQAPDLLVDDYAGPHINVMKSKGGQIHSIMIPVSTADMALTPEQEKTLLVMALKSASAMLGEPPASGKPVRLKK